MPNSPAILASEWVLGWAALYAAVGVLVALAFVLAGVKPALRFQGPISPGARLLFFPAAVALWPLILRRWIAARR